MTNYITTLGQPDDIYQELKEYVASYPVHNLFWKTLKAFIRLRVFETKSASDVLYYALVIAGDYGDFTKPVILSHTTFLEDKGYEEQSKKNFYRGLKELLALGLIEYISGKYAKPDAYKEKEKVFGEKTFKTRSYYETNAYYITPAIAYGVVASFLIERKDTPPSLLSRLARIYREELLKAFGKDFTRLSMKALNEKIEELQTPYLLPAFTLSYLRLGLLDPFSEEVRELSERLKVLFTGEPQQLTLPMSPSTPNSQDGDTANMTVSDMVSKTLSDMVSKTLSHPPNSSDMVSKTLSDMVSKTLSDMVSKTHNHQSFILHPSNPHTHTVEKERTRNETSSQNPQPAKPQTPPQTPEGPKPHSVGPTSPPPESPHNGINTPTEDTPSNAYSFFLELPETQKEFVLECLRHNGAQNPFGLLKRMSVLELETNLDTYLASKFNFYKELRKDYTVWELLDYYTDTETTEYRLEWQDFHTMDKKKLRDTIYGYILEKLSQPMEKERFAPELKQAPIGPIEKFLISRVVEQLKEFGVVLSEQDKIWIDRQKLLEMGNYAMDKLIVKALRKYRKRKAQKDQEKRRPPQKQNAPDLDF